jgi:hypothetical protein
MSKYFFIILLLYFYNFSAAQKSLQYNSFFQGRYFQFVLKYQSTDKIYGHCIDFQDKSKHLIEGKIINPGNIIELTCKDHLLFKYIRLKEDINNPLNLSGFFYAPDAYIGHLTLNNRPEDFNFEENKDIETVNLLYRLMLEDFHFNPSKVSVPFKQDSESGLYMLNSENGYKENRGNPASSRKLLNDEGLLYSIQEQRNDFSDGHYKQKLYFQVLAYTPYHSVMVISEETDSKISKTLDTSFVMKYKIAVYSLKAKDAAKIESWSNETDNLVEAASVELIKEKFPNCAVNLNPEYIELIFNRKCRITPSLPKTILYVPELIGSTKNKTLIINWQNSKLEIE